MKADRRFEFFGPTILRIARSRAANQPAYDVPFKCRFDTHKHDGLVRVLGRSRNFSGINAALNVARELNPPESVSASARSVAVPKTAGEEGTAASGL